jgi:glutathione S-transferase
LDTGESEESLNHVYLLLSLVRFLLEYLELPYEDRRYNSPEEWATDKAALASNSPLVNLPYLQDGETTVFESGAIPVYLAHKAGRADLFGTNSEQQVTLAQARGVLEDLRKGVMGLFFGFNKEEFEAKGKELVREAATKHLVKLEYLLNGRKFLAGDNVSVVDFGLYETLDLFRIYDETLLANFPGLRATHANFRELPRIKAYLESERFQERPFFPPQWANWG